MKRKTPPGAAPEKPDEHRQSEPAKPVTQRKPAPNRARREEAGGQGGKGGKGRGESLERPKDGPHLRDGNVA